MPNPSIVPITQPRIPFLNPETGFVSMPWYRFLLSLSQLTSGSDVSLGDLQKGPPTLTIDEVNAIIDRASGDINPSQDGLLAQIAELQKQMQAQELYDCCNALIGQVAELQKQVEALQMQPLAGQGIVNAVTGTAPVVSSGGTAPNISLASGYGDTQNPYASKTANNYLAAPNGVAGVPTFRAMVAADVPTLNQNTTGTASNVTGTVAIANGGTGQTTRQNAMDALAGAVTSGQYLRGNGTDVVMSAIQVADVPALPYAPTAAPATYAANFAVAATDVWIINNKSGSSCVVTLPTPSASTGRVLYFQNYQAQTLVSASSNVVPLVGGAAGTAILAAVAGDTTTLVSNGTSWIITQSVPNNVLLLE